MKKLGLACLVSLGGAMAATPAHEARGSYVEARTADVYVGACFANSEVGLTGDLAVMGWRIEQGSWSGVKLDGLKVAAAVRASSTLGDWTGSAYPVKSVLMVDERASVEQRWALREFARRMTGDLLEDIVREVAVPIEFEVEGHGIHGGRVSMSAGTLAAIRTRAIEAGDHSCGHEVTWYSPLAKTEHAMAAYALKHSYSGAAASELRARWSSPDKRSAFVATFHLAE